MLLKGFLKLEGAELTTKRCCELQKANKLKIHANAWITARKPIILTVDGLKIS